MLLMNLKCILNIITYLLCEKYGKVIILNPFLIKFKLKTNLNTINTTLKIRIK